MTPASPAPVAATVRTRIKWENLMLAGIVVVAVVLAVVGVIASSADSGTDPATTPDPALVTPEASPGEGTDDAAASAAAQLTLTDATALVEEARQLMSEARWDEAEERLTSIPQDLYQASGASALMLELEGNRTQYTELRERFDAAVEARQWKAADQLFERMKQIAQPNDELTAAHAAALAALAAPATQSAAAEQAQESGRPSSSSTANGGGSTTTGTASASGGGQSATSKPQSSKPKPKPSGTNNGSSAGAGSTGTGTGTGTGSSSSTANPLGDIQITAEQQAALEQALAEAQAQLQ